MNQPLPIEDIHLPAELTAWSLAMGWWVLLILTPLLLYGFWQFYKYLTRKTPIKTAKKQLNQLKNNTELSDYQKICELSILLRRVAISTLSRAKTAALVGDDWLQFLESILKDKRFSEGVGKLLISVPYQTPSTKNYDINALISLSADWLNGLAKTKHDSF